MKKRILYIVSTLSRTGPTNQLLGLVSGLNKEGFEPKVLTLAPHPDNSRHKDFENLGVQVDSLNLSRKEFLIRGSKQLKEYISKDDPDLIHTSGVRADSAVAKLDIADRHCMTLHNFAMEDYVAKYGNLLGKILTRSTTKAINNCDFVICCSNTLTKKYASYYDKTFLPIQNGIDTTFFSRPDSKEEIIEIRKKNNLSLDQKIFLLVGSMIKRKDPLTVIKAFEQSDVSNAQLVVLGDGPLLEEAKELAISPNIDFRGNVSNVEEFMRSADFYVSASLSEGLPMSVLEAGSIGMDMILSDIPQHREVFENSSVDVTFFETKNLAELSRLFAASADSTRLEINDKMADHIEMNFSNERMTAEYESVYRKMLEYNTQK